MTAGRLGIDRKAVLPEGSAPPDAAARIDTVAVVLGPYRNLTTLTASALALHPQVQVLNHAAERLWQAPEADFLSWPDEAHLRPFIEKALVASTGGKRGQHGGSILMSHAFDEESLQGLYAARFGDLLLKPDARVLVWKDSMLVQKKLMARQGAINQVLDALPQVRFLLPIRHPLDCAVSNIKNQHVIAILDRMETDLSIVLDAVLDVLAWALTQADQRPDRFFIFTEGQSAQAMLPQLRDFLGLEVDQRWLDDAVSAFAVRPKARDPQQMALFRAKAQDRLGAWPDVLNRLLAL
jgi:hypothetical protein